MICEFRGNCKSPIIAAVFDDENFGCIILLLEKFSDFLQALWKPICFVISRNNDGKERVGVQVDLQKICEEQGKYDKNNDKIDRNKGSYDQPLPQAETHFWKVWLWVLLHFFIEV